MDKINLDFEACKVEIITDSQHSIETCAKLPARKEAILKAMGFMVFDITKEIDQLNDWINGGQEPEFFKETAKIVRCKDCVNWSEAMLKCYRELDDEHSFHGAPDIWKPDDFCSYGKKRAI